MTPSQLWPLALGAILNERNHDDHDVLGGSLRPRHAARATTILATGWDVRSPGEARAAIAWLFDGGHREAYAADGLGSAESFAAWDYCRAANVAGWGFVAYYFDRETAWSFLLRAATLVQSTYRSFEEMGESYLRGMRRWSGGDGDRVRRSEEAFAKLTSDPAGPFRHAWDTPLDGTPPPSIEQKEAEIGPGDSILEAMQRVGSGGRVILAPGHYTESITPPHSLEIVARGDGEVVLEAQGRPALWAKSEVRSGEARAICLSVRGVTVRAARSADGKTLNATSVPGGYLRLHDCDVTATHHGVSVRDGGLLFVSRSRIAGCGQNGVWCDGGSVTIVGSELRELGVHGAYVGKSPHANAIEETTIAGVAEVALVAEAELRVRRSTIDSPGKCGVAVHAPVLIADATIRGSRGWGIAVEKGGALRIAKTTIDASVGANLDVKDGSVDATDCVLANGVSSGLVVQAKGRVLLVDTRIEDHAQGNVYAIPGARLFATRATVRGEASGVWLKDAAATFLESRITSTKGTALDLRAGEDVVLEQCAVAGGVTLGAGAKLRLAACDVTGDRDVAEGAAIEECTHEDVCEAIEAALASVQTSSELDPRYH